MPALSINLQEKLWEVANTLADEAGKIALQYFRSPSQSIENKLDIGFDPVTIADKSIERTMRDILAKYRPDDGILGEEYASIQGTTGLTWVLDPIDGTKGFISGTPTWGVLIAVDNGQGPILGIVDQPFTGERYSGGFGNAELTHNGKTCSIGVRSCASIQDAVLYSTMPDIGTAKETKLFQKISSQVKLTRYGTDCYAYALLAAGHIDLVIEAGLNAFDVQGPIAVIQNAGGIVTNWQGEPAHMGGQLIAAGDKRIHAEVLKLLGS